MQPHRALVADRLAKYVSGRRVAHGVANAYAALGDAKLGKQPTPLGQRVARELLEGTTQILPESVQGRFVKLGRHGPS